jgi:fatty acid desaturase
MKQLFQFVVSWITGLMRGAQENYGVDPVVFLVIYLGTAPFFYYSIFRMVRALAKRLQGEVMLWSTIFLAATAAPFIYVLFFGRNLPWWVYVVIALLLGQGVFSLVRKLRKKPGAPEKK